MARRYPLNTYLIGGNGRLGRAIARRHADAGIILLERSTYEDWSQSNAASRIARYFDKHTGDATIFVASGLLDPRLPQDELLRVNYLLPKNVIDGATPLGIKVVTFGTVMESLLTSGNTYVQSKKKLGEYAAKSVSDGSPVLHLQIHTLYGLGQPSPFMFLGQMLTAIQNNEPFRMTSGRQLREYHHLADEALAIRLIAERSELTGVRALSHGRPMSLREIAEKVFAALGKDHLLQIGTLPEPTEENYGKIFEPMAMLRAVEFRNEIQGVVEYMSRCYASNEADPETIV